MKTVSVVTINYNQPLVTEELLDSIVKTNSYPALEIIVVDNASRQNIVPEWEIRYPNVKFIRSEVNLGFAGGNNLGLKQATGDYLFLVNNDTEFTSGLVEQLVAILDRDPLVGIISPKIRYHSKPDMVQYAGYTKMNYYTARNSCVGQYATDEGQYDDLTGETGFVHGAAMMVRRETVENAGPMPENYFLYYEEMDWCERIRDAGYSIWMNAQAVIYHKESVSVGVKSAAKEYFMNRNRILFVRRNGPLAARIAFWPYFIFVVATRNIITYTKHKQWGFIPILLKAIYWNLTNGTDSPKLGYTLKN